MDTETVNSALGDVGLIWSLGPRGVVLVDASDRFASLGARSTGTLSQYVAMALRKGKTESEMAAALRSKVDGDPGPYDAIESGPDV